MDFLSQYFLSHPWLMQNGDIFFRFVLDIVLAFVSLIVAPLALREAKRKKAEFPPENPYPMGAAYGLCIYMSLTSIQCMLCAYTEGQALWSHNNTPLGQTNFPVIGMAGIAFMLLGCVDFIPYAVRYNRQKSALTKTAPE